MRRTFMCGLAALLAVASSAQAAIIYDASVQTASRVNVGQAGFFGAGDTGSGARVIFDDVPISNATLGLNTSLQVTKVTVGIRQVGTVAAPAPATDVSVFWTTFNSGAVAPDTQIDIPSNLIGTTNIAASTVGVTTLVSFGDGVAPLFTVPLNTTLIAGFGSFGLGVNLSNINGANGWRLTTPAVGSANAGGAVWAHDPAQTSGLAGAPTEIGPFNFGAPPAPAATFYIVLEGTPVPEPTTLSLLAVGGLMLLKRRRA
jgi:hypothetical protein